MKEVNAALSLIADGRTADPLRPVTVIAPSHAAALQMRRLLAEITPFAAVRFETLPRLAELLGAGHLAAAGRAPLARPIGDYVAGQVARDSGDAFAGVRDLAGYARVLRQLFRRLRRGGITSSTQIGGTYPPHAGEIFRLYDGFRAASAAFYDEEDLLDAAAAAVEEGRAGALADLGDIYVTPPGALTAAGTRFLQALRMKAPAFIEIGEAEGTPASQRFVLAPDPASEARMVVREVLDALEAGVPIHELAVFCGADASYGRLLRETFDAAGVPVAALPGVPLIETRAGRGVLALAELPANNFSRAAAMELLAIAPLKDWLPGEGDNIRLQTNAWDRLSREAGITRGRDIWEQRLSAFIADREAELARDDDNEARVRAIGYQLEDAQRLRGVITQLISRMEPLRERLAAATFIDAFKAIVEEYFAPGSELEKVIDEIDQLGTVGAVGGDFSLESFTRALRANLESAPGERKTRFGDGVVVAEYRVAAGLQFQRVILCGAFEGALPAGPGSDAILDDRIWHQLKAQHAFIEDAATRIDRSREAAFRAVATADGGELTWSAPSYEPGGAREYYPSPMMADAYSQVVGRRVTASQLRAEKASEISSRPGSALGSMLARAVVDRGEMGLRDAVSLVHNRGQLAADDPRARPVRLILARGSEAFTEWDGNLAAVAGDIALDPQRAVSPTSLEAFGSCGFKYFGRSVLRLNVVQEPDERQMLDARDRGTLIHDVLQHFFMEQQQRGRPGVREMWDAADEARLIEMAREAIRRARERGITGLDIYTQHEVRTIVSDLRLFLRHDNVFRWNTGAVPTAFEQAIPETEVAGVRLRGYVDRIDRTPGGEKAWIIDYKTGSAYDTKAMKPDDMLAGGQKLQLPVYLSAAEAQEAYAMYWFITQKGGFEQFYYPNTPENRERFEATLTAILNAIRAGSFPAIPNDEDEFRGGFQNCGYCDFDRICSRRRDLEQQAKTGDAGVAPWRNVGLTARGEDS